MKKWRFKLWVDDEQGLFLGNGRVRLLQEIGRTGSISAAARSLGLSYKKAWDQVDAMNALAPEPLVLTSAGGKGGGGATLTQEGEHWVHRFTGLTQQMDQWMNSNVEQG